MEVLMAAFWVALIMLLATENLFLAFVVYLIVKSATKKKRRSDADRRDAPG